MITRRRILIAAPLAALCIAPALAQPQARPRSLHLRDLTWMEVRDAVAGGFTAVLVPTGGVEQNGPHMALDKHDRIVTRAAERIAAGVGGMLIAPVLSIVPEGSYDPPTDNMRWPGTIGVPEPVFEAVLDGVARSLRGAGFTSIFFIGDHGMSQAPQARVAQRLSREWARRGVAVHQVDAYYDDRAQIARLRGEGRTDDEIGVHAGLADTSELMAAAPEAVDLRRLEGVTRLAELGASGAPHKASAELGESLLQMRIDAATRSIRSLLGRQG